MITRKRAVERLTVLLGLYLAFRDKRSLDKVIEDILRDE
jgi:hypothetical protein